MRLERLHVQRAPGLHGGLPVVEFGAGLTVVVGPNASGKSTLVRAARALLWPTVARWEGKAEARWLVDGAGHEAELFARRVSWQPELAAPPPEQAAQLVRLDVRTLLQGVDATDAEVARRIAQELAGGLDLVKAAESFNAPGRLTRQHRLVREREAAARALRQANDASGRLEEDERRLVEVERGIEAAKRAQRQRDAASALCELVRARAALRELELGSSEFDADLRKLSGGEKDRIEDLTRRQAAAKSTLDGHQGELDALTESTAELQFAAGAPTPEQVEAWELRVAAVAVTEKQVRDLEVDLAEAEAMAEEAADRLEGEAGGVDGRGPDLRRATLEKLGRALQATSESEARVAGLEAVVEAWQRWATSAAGEDAHGLEGLRDAVRALRRWLRLPETLQARAATWILLGLGVIAAAAGLVGGLAGEPAAWPAWLLAAAGVSIVATLLVARFGSARRELDAARALARATVERAGLAPETWEREAVERRLDELERRAADLELAGRAAERVGESKTVRDKAEAELRSCDEALRAIGREAGLSDEFVDLAVADQLQVLRMFREAEGRRIGLVAGLADVRRQLGQGLEELGRDFVRFGADDPDDASAARAVARQLEARARDLRQAETDSTRVQKAVGAARAVVEELDGELAKLWHKVGVDPGDSTALRARMAAHARWTEHEKAVGDQRVLLERARLAFEALDGAMLPLADRDPEQVPEAEAEDWVTAVTALAETHSELTEERGGINSRLSAAGQGTVFADAVSRQHAVDAGLAQARERAAEDALARMLLDEACDQHATEHAPRILRRAKDRFAAFTGHEFSLELGGEDGRSFRALSSTTGDLLTLEQLSDGTRVQLLFAARLAAIEAVEAGSSFGALPLYLDETLATTDPARFREIASTLLEAVDSGRQVVYLTADPGEAEQWRQVAHELGKPEPTFVDLGALRGKGADWGGELPAAPRPPAAVPDLAGLSPVACARELGVSLPDGFEPWQSWHVYVAMHDEREAMLACLGRRIVTLGHWGEARRAGWAPAGIGDDVLRRIDARFELLAAVHGLWGKGRGRPITWEDIEQSGAVSATYEDRVRELLAAHARQPRAFLEVLRSGALRGFRQNKITDLEATLRERGCLASDAPIPVEDLARLALANVDDAALAPFADWVVQLLESAPGHSNNSDQGGIGGMTG